jgi:hypothetical protein
MKRPVFRFVFEAVTAVVVLSVCGIFALMIRLDKGPLPLGGSLPEIGEFVSDFVPGLNFEIQSAVLSRGKGRMALEIDLQHVMIFNNEKKAIGDLKAMRLGYSWRNVLGLSVVPRVLTLESPTVHVTRFEDGHIGFNLQSEEARKKERSDIPELAHLMSRMNTALREIHVEDAWIKFIDQKEGLEATLTSGKIALFREGTKINGLLAASVSAGDFKQDIEGEIHYDPYRDVTEFSAELRDIPMDRVIALFPELPDELHVNMNLNLAATALIDAQMQPVGVDMRISGEKGTVQYPPYFPKEIPMERLVGVARYNPIDGILNIDEISFNLFGSATASLTAKRRPLAEEGSVGSKIELVGLLNDFPVDQLGFAWPAAFATDAQEWVTKKITGGIVPQAAIALEGTLNAEDKFTVTSLNGKLNYKDLTVNYLPPMPPVKNVSGVAQYDTDNFNLQVTSGDLIDTKVNSADVKISGLSRHDQHIEIDLDLDGPIKDAITTISSEPLQFPQEMGLTPSQFSGNAKTKLWLKFPLRHDLSVDMVEMKTDAIVDGLVLKNVVKNVMVSGSQLSLTADPTRMTVMGKANIDGGAVDLAWTEFFGTGDTKTTLDVNGTIMPAVLKNLNLPMDDYFTGSAQADMKLTRDRQSNLKIVVAADLEKSGLSIAELNANKTPGSAGNLSMDIAADAAGAATLENINASWSGFEIKDGMVRWNKNGDLEAAAIKGFKGGRMAADITAIPTPNGKGVTLNVTGDTLDFSNYWTKQKKPQVRGAPAKTHPMNIRLKGKTVYLDPETPFKNLNASLDFVGDDLVRGDVSGNVDGGTLSMKQTVGAKGVRNLSVSMKNAGAVLRALDMTDTVRGGNFTMNGRSSEKNPKVISGRALMTNFSMVKAPVLARLVSAVSPVGLIELLENKGLFFGKMEANVILESPQSIRIKDGKMAGTSLGLSFSGRVYRDTGTVNLKGNVVPIEGLNKAVGKIPLIGQILTGLKGEGMIAFAYKIKGKMDNPDVTVNPLSVFTPGILRSIFFDN